MPMKVKTKKQLIKACDIAWSKAVKVRDDYTCQMCGSVSGLNSHHIIGRINYSLRFDLKNGLTLCSSCHKFSRNSAHNNPVYFIDWYKKHYPEDYEYLLTKKNIIAKYLDYETILQELKEVSK
jgi:hypothetical protein